MLQDSAASREHIANRLHGRSFAVLVRVLEDFLMLQSDVQVLTEDTLHAIVTVIAILKNYDEAHKVAS